MFDQAASAKFVIAKLFIPKVVVPDQQTIQVGFRYPLKIKESLPLSLEQYYTVMALNQGVSAKIDLGLSPEMLH